MKAFGGDLIWLCGHFLDGFVGVDDMAFFVMHIVDDGKDKYLWVDPRDKQPHAEDITELLIAGKVDSGGGRKYAYGFEDGRKDGVGAVGHGGGAPGMSGDLRIYPHSGYVVAVLSNLDLPAAPQVSAFLDLRLPK